MGLKSYKPNTPSLRNMVTSDFSEVTRATPEKSLTKGKKSTGGRNNLRALFSGLYHGNCTGSIFKGRGRLAPVVFDPHSVDTQLRGKARGRI